MNLIIETEQGFIEGISSEDKETRIFKGVPYAKAPVGNLRFRKPEKKGKWVGIRPCKSYSPKAYQCDQTKGDLYPKEFYSGDLPPMSEDCLYLNIFTPSIIKEKCPVLFWIHGGAFMHGYGSEITMNGEAFAQKGIIVVTINYRTGALGFFTHSDLEEDGTSGNYGIYDQIAALNWVYDNIEAFGGDKHKITIAGQSAGCMSCAILLGSKLTEGKIHGAILQSAIGLPGFKCTATKEEVESVSKELMDLLHVSTIEEMKELEPENICYGAYQLMEQKNNELIFYPHVDGVLLEDSMENIIQNSTWHKIPKIIGSTTDELGFGTGEILEKGCIGLALNEEKFNQEVYVYHFERRLPGSEDGAFHSSELWYEFQTLDACWRDFETKDYQISNELSAHFSNFIKNGNPNGENVSNWEPYTKQNPFRMIYK